MRWLFAALILVLSLQRPAPVGAEIRVVREPIKEPAKDVKKVQPPGTGPALLDFFRRRTPSPNDEQAIRAAIRRLGDEAFRVRERASAELLRVGPLAAPLLRQALADPDPEVVTRARKCLERIEKDFDPALVAAAAQRLAQLRPAGAVDALLNFLPFARDESVTTAVQAALGTLAMRDGKADPALVQALKDRVPVKRSAAGLALLQKGPANLRPDVRKLLTDPEPLVRLRMAQGFVEARDKAGIPVLIALLGELPAAQARQAEDTLVLIAGDQAPQIARPDKARETWAAWWQQHEARIDLMKVAAGSRQLGYTLVVLRTPGTVLEVDRGGRVRWQITGLRYPVDAQVVGKDRVLIAEYQGQRVTERTFKGDILWEKKFNRPVGCQRMRNGNTLIVGRREVLDIKPNGETAFAWKPKALLVAAARKQPDGHVVLFTTSGQVVTLDAAGQTIKTFATGNRPSIGGGFDLLPGGHLLIADLRSGKVIEYDADGKPIWQREAVRPMSAVRLPGGHTLITNYIDRRVTEIDRAGKVVWQYQPQGLPVCARRR